MLLHPTLDKLKALKLEGMLAGVADQEALPEVNALSFEERLGLLVDRELTARQNHKLKLRLGKAKLRQEAAPRRPGLPGGAQSRSQSDPGALLLRLAPPPRELHPHRRHRSREELPRLRACQQSLPRRL